MRLGSPIRVHLRSGSPDCAKNVFMAIGRFSGREIASLALSRAFRRSNGLDEMKILSTGPGAIVRSLTRQHRQNISESLKADVGRSLVIESLGRRLENRSGEVGFGFELLCDREQRKLKGST